MVTWHKEGIQQGVDTKQKQRPFYKPFYSRSIGLDHMYDDTQRFAFH